MKTLKKIQLLALFAIFFSSCADYLDVSKELSAELDMEQVLNNVEYTKRFHRYIYSGIPRMMHIILDESGKVVENGLGNPWTSMCDELICSQGSTKNLNAIGYNANNAGFSRWGLYKQIRQANLFLEKAHTIPALGDVADYIDEALLEKMKIEARFLRAYYHYLLFELYGPIPIVTTSADPAASDLDYYRNSVDEVVDFIDKELMDCYAALPDKEEKNREAAPTKIVALAVRAKLHVYAASPLFNGGYGEAVALKDNQGKQLFPAADPKKWETALNALQTLIDYANSHGYSLYKVENPDGGINAEQSLYELFQEYETNPEIIWASSANDWGTLAGDGRERRCTPRSIFSGFSNVGIVQEMIDAFFMADGKDINESDNYTAAGIGEDGIPNMYKKREPRFYQSVTYAGVTWQNTDKKIFFHKGQGNDNTAADNCRSGYLLYKGMNKKLLNSGNYPRNQYRPSIIFRLAEFYLLYAEALNHVKPGDPLIMTYIDYVRERAGIPTLKSLGVPNTQVNMEEAIRRERRVELFTEGQRYFDVRRWMIADQDGTGRQNGDFHGMDMNALNIENFMKVVSIEKRIFERRMYLYPIPQNEIRKSKKLIQNPGW